MNFEGDFCDNIAPGFFLLSYWNVYNNLVAPWVSSQTKKEKKEKKSGLKGWGTGKGCIWLSIQQVKELVIL